MNFNKKKQNNKQKTSYKKHSKYLRSKRRKRIRRWWRRERLNVMERANQWRKSVRWIHWNWLIRAIISNPEWNFYANWMECWFFVVGPWKWINLANYNYSLIVNYLNFQSSALIGEILREQKCLSWKRRR